MDSILNTKEEMASRAKITAKVIRKNERILQRCGFIIPGTFKHRWIHKKLAMEIHSDKHELDEVSDVVALAFSQGLITGAHHVRTAVKQALQIV